MMPHIHFLFSLILINFFFKQYFADIDVFIFILGSIIIDIDILFSSNHRSLITHKPFIYFIGFIISLLFNYHFAVFFLAILFHLLLDTIDWEVELFYPFIHRKFSIINLNYEDFSGYTKLDFLRLYYSNKFILISESIIILLGIFSFF